MTLKFKKSDIINEHINLTDLLFESSKILLDKYFKTGDVELKKIADNLFSEYVDQKKELIKYEKMKGGAIQSIIFDKTLNSPESSRIWIMSHTNLTPKKMHETDQYYRYRITPPNNKKKYITRTLKNGIKLIIEI